MTSRRDFLTAAAGMAAVPLAAQTQMPPARRAAVALVKGESRRTNISQALASLDKQILPLLKRKKYVVIKPNLVSTQRQLAASHADAMHGILDYLGPRFKGEVYIAESSAGDTTAGFSNLKFDAMATERKSQKVKLLDLNEEGRYEVIHILDADLHPVPVRLAARLLDPDAFIISSSMLKTHNTVVATMGVKNMSLGAPLHQPRKSSERWNDKRNYHGGVRQTNYDIMLTAQKLSQYWGLSVIDGFEGMEGNGPGNGTPVASKCAIASTDFIAADRIGVEAMSINPDHPGYLNFCGKTGVGIYDLNQIDVIGNRLDEVKLVYRMHNDLDRELQWMGPMKELPPKLG